MKIPEKLRYIRPSASKVWVKCSAAPQEVTALGKVANEFAQTNNGNNASGAAGDPAREGQLGHEACELLLAGETEINVRGLALKYGVDEKEAEFMVLFARRAVKNMPWPDWHFATEVPVKIDISELHPALSGTCDFLAWSEPDENGEYELGIIDWKFGRNEVELPETNYQIWCYAIMAAATFQLGPVKAVRAQVRYPRLGKRTQVNVFSRDDLAAMTESLRLSVVKCYARTPEYRTGQHCEDCNARNSCPVLNKALAVFADGLVETDGKPVKPFLSMSPEEAGKALSVARLLDRYKSEIVAAAKIYVDMHGEIRLPDGRVYSKKNSKRRAIDLSAEGAWQVLESACGQQALLNGVKISKTAVVGAAAEKFLSDNNKSRFGRGERKQLENDLMTALDEQGAVNEYTASRYEYTRPEKQ